MSSWIAFAVCLLVSAAPSVGPSAPLVDFNAERYMYRFRIAQMFEQEHFDQLEAEAARLRKERPRFASGTPKLYDFYAALDPYSKNVVSQGKQDEYVQRSAKWSGLAPKSYVARIALINSHIYRAWKARGDGFADSVSEEQGRQFKSELSAAWTVAMDAERLDAVDAELFTLELTLCKGLGKARQEVDQVFQKGVKADVGFDQLYVEMANYLLPRWFGSGPELHDFALRAAELSKQELGDIMYARVAMTAMLVERQDFRTVYLFQWPRLKAALEELNTRYPASRRTLNFLCWFAWHYDDRATAARTLAQLGPDWTTDSAEIWLKPQVLEQMRSWAAAAGSK